MKSDEISGQLANVWFFEIESKMQECAVKKKLWVELMNIWPIINQEDNAAMFCS